MARKRPLESAPPVAPAAVPKHPYDSAIRNRHPDEVAPEHRAEFLAVLRAFVQYDAADDAGARETLQAIGATSPFSDWKLLIRGLIAFQANDDVRALENWRRLSATRLPHQLAAPFRMQCDAAFADVQPAAVKAQAAHCFGTPMLRSVLDLIPLLGRDQPLGKAFAVLEKLLPLVKAEKPALLPRLAGILYEAVARYGEPKDLVQYRKLFHAPADDPDFHRINALGYEDQSPAEAVKHWEAYDRWLQTNPPGWGPDLIRVSRSLLLRHLARLCAVDELKSAMPLDMLAAMNIIMGGGKDRLTIQKAPLPDPLKYWQASFALNPADEETTTDLMMTYERQDQPEKAVEIARKHLAAKPDSLDVLVDLGKLLVELRRPLDAYDVYETALRTNPLDRDLRRIAAALAHGAVRAALGAGGDKALIAKLLKVAVDNDESAMGLQSHSIQAILARKAKDAAAAAVHDAALNAIPHARLAVAVMLAADATLAKLKPAERKPFDESLKQILAGPVTLGEAMLAANLFHQFTDAGIDYRGRGTTEKKIKALLLTAVKTDATADEPLLIGLGKLLIRSEDFELLDKVAAAMHDRFPMNPWFTLFLAESVLGKATVAGKPPQWRKLDTWTNKTRRLIRNHPDAAWITRRLAKISDPAGPADTDDYTPN